MKYITASLNILHSFSFPTKAERLAGKASGEHVAFWCRFVVPLFNVRVEDLRREIIHDELFRVRVDVARELVHVRDT